MPVQIRPFRAVSRGVEIDMGIDAVWLIEAGVERQIGVIGRDRNAPIQLFNDGVAPVILKYCQQAAAERDAQHVPDCYREQAKANVREVQQPPPAIEEEDDDNDEDDNEE